MKDPKVVAGSVAEYLFQLSTASKTLNELSDVFTQQVIEVETAINKLNLGITASVVAVRASSEDGILSHYTKLAYGKHAGKWGLIVEDFDDDMNDPGFDNYQSWPFRDAPRELRLVVVERIPELLQALLKKSADVTSEISTKLEYAIELATGLLPTGLSQGKDAGSRGSK